MKRIALMTWTQVYGTGGMEGSILRIARSLTRHFDVEVDILMLLPTEQVEFHTEGMNGIDELASPSDRIHLYKLGTWTGGTLELHKWGDIHRAILELHEIRQYHLIHGFYASISGFIAVFVARELGLPCVVSIRGCDVSRDVFNTGRFQHLHWALENATFVTALSEELLNRADVISPCKQKGRVILNSIDPEYFSDGIHESLPTGHPLVGSLGVFRNLKGLEVLLSAFRMVISDLPQAHLLLIGDIKSDEKDNSLQMIARYGLHSRTSLTGFVQHREVLRYLRSLDLFVFTSLQDACPNVILEAMLAEVPIVASDVGAVSELLGKHGRLVKPGSAQSLSEEIRKTLASTNSREMAANARLRAIDEFTPYREAAEYIEVYRLISDGFSSLVTG